MPDLTELDRLIEEGLTLYGHGDLDGALLVWEKALAMDPANAQANSYVDYVRSNYDMLTNDSVDTADVPFGIAEDEPEYHIEISPGDIKPGGAPMYMDPTDEGWPMSEEPQRPSGPMNRNSESEETLDKSIDDDPALAPQTLEIDADEPPLPAPAPPAETSDVGFEDATREYQPSRAKELEASMRELDKGKDGEREEATSEFNSEAGTGGFSQASQTTGIKKRDLGFVKPVEPPPDPDDLPGPPPSSPRPRGASKQPPELKMTLRTPAVEEPAPSTTAPEHDDLALAHEAPPADDLISSLPSPKPSHTTLDMPAPAVRPAVGQPGPSTRAFLEELDAGEPELPPEVSVSFHTAPTREHHYAAPVITESMPERNTNTRDFSEKPTQEIYNRPAAEPDPVVSAPTRELGLRSAVATPRAVTEDEPTSAKPPLDLSRVAVETGEGTRSDIVLPFDPIDARSQQILEAVDEGAPTSEAKDDRTRRRISALLDRATEWNKVGELDRAVAAVDLALSEDPNSALAQKLIHRNREAILGVFQGFLGDLNRQPMLARPLHELATAPISPRAAFLLSRIDGSLSLDEILDVSGMPRLEAYRHLCQLYLRGILR